MPVPAFLGVFGYNPINFIFWQHVEVQPIRCALYSKWGASHTKRAYAAGVYHPFLIPQQTKVSLVDNNLVSLDKFPVKSPLVICLPLKYLPQEECIPGLCSFHCEAFYQIEHFVVQRLLIDIP
ncbi:uncharacterized protein LACBIDRAFT_322451 [Laccaria bicolor S238N-H82]|uniref:Predicted protein n=1 Tax=Laccaria bicolor (strain S238N-H82 / ATCC MYA-4686) TaxID=486041 RepID=B0CWB8_LACBS|nr:uncharacterized protein LACBIDRAFT_322451 [Laccaria bicolor S238N-H82]EDR13482.1 predicted protein [Laccaria bicolor S238N-H82]|eukprot:XP_001875980.1 predicted protein [Laccaria bicolor S238N-H82]